MPPPGSARTAGVRGPPRPRPDSAHAVDEAHVHPAVLSLWSLHPTGHHKHRLWAFRCENKRGIRFAELTLSPWEVSCTDHPLRETRRRGNLSPRTSRAPTQPLGARGQERALPPPRAKGASPTPGGRQEESQQTALPSVPPLTTLTSNF